MKAKKVEGGNWLIRLAIRYLRANGVRVVWPKPKKRIKKAEMIPMPTAGEKDAR